MLANLLGSLKCPFNCKLHFHCELRDVQMAAVRRHYNVSHQGHQRDLKAL